MRTIKRDIVGAFIASSDKKLLLGNSRKGGVYSGAWIVPGGGIDEGETEEQALAREILEETGLDISGAKVSKVDIQLTGQSEKTLKETNETVLVDMVFHNYLVEMPEASDVYQTNGLDDFENARWVPFEELKNLTMSPPTIETLRVLGYLE